MRGGHHAAAGQPAVALPLVGDHGHELVAVDQPALLAGKHDTVGVAVERDAEIGAVHDDAFLQKLRMGRAAIAIDVESVGPNGERDHLGAQFPQHRRRDLVGSAIGAIDDDLEAGKIEAARGRGLHRLDVSSVGIVEALRPADGRGRGELHFLRRQHQLLDRGLDRVGELEAVGTEQLDAIVLVGIVRRRDHHAHVGAHGAGEKSNGRRRQRPQQQHVHANRQEARRQRLLDHIAGEARVLAHHDAMAMAAAAEDLARRHADAHGDIGGHGLRIGAAPHAIGAEEGA